jgi:hypothetical protein
MLRFPLRLTTDLAKARFSKRSRPALNRMQFVDAAELLHHDSNHPVSHEKIRELVSSGSPVVWIGGSEPLNHPGTGHLVRAIAGSGHFVFLETDGTLLRRRIHEFQPVPRLFLMVRLEPEAQLLASKSLRPSLAELALEGIRAAQLSGFLVCVHARIDSPCAVDRCGWDCDFGCQWRIEAHNCGRHGLAAQDGRSAKADREHVVGIVFADR